MKLLLDTCTFLWLAGGGPLSHEATNVIRTAANDVFLSSASVWEIVTKFERGRLPLPAPPERLLDPETFAYELYLAEIADGVLPRFLSEQRSPKSDVQLKAEEAAARAARGEAAMKKSQAGGKLTREEFADQCYYLDPVSNKRPPPRRRKGGSV